MTDFFHQLPIISTIGLVLLFGFLGSRLARLVKLPSVTGYIFAGVVVGKSVLGWIPDAPGSSLPLFLENISLIALGIIAFSIGAELRFTKLKKLGKSVLAIAIVAAAGSTLAITGAIMLVAWIFPGLLLPGSDLRDIFSLALILGAIGSATAPAAVLSVINEYKSKGPVTEALLATVAIDDVFCILIFGLIFPVATALVGGGAAGSPLSFSGMVLHPVREIVLSLVMGGLAGLFVVWLVSFIRGKSSQLVIILGFILLLSGLAAHFHLSPLLTNMTLGCVLINLSPRGGLVLSAIDNIEPPLFVAFFTIAGIHLDLKLLAGIGVLGLLYFFARVLGKVGGASLGAVLSRAPRIVRRYVGLGLLPQAGVAIGLVLLVQEQPQLNQVLLGGKSFSAIITNCILATVALNELIGPLAAKFALSKAKEIHQEVVE